MASRFVLPFADVGSGISPEDGAKLFFFITGTSTPKDTFSDEALTTPNANPVIADANGLFSDIWVPDAARYKVQLKDKNDVQTWEADPVAGGVSPALITKTFDVVADMVASPDLNIGDIIGTTGYLTKGDGGDNCYEVVSAATGTADGGSFIDLTGIAGQVKGLFQLGRITTRQFGVVGDGVANDTPKFNAIQAAFPSGVIYVIKGIHLLNAGLNNVTTISWIIESGTTFTGASVLRGRQITHGAQVDTWVDDIQSGVYEYLESNSSHTVKDSGGGIAGFGATHSNNGVTPGPSTANIAFATFGANDDGSTGQNVWGLYTTVINETTTTKTTHAYEFDVAHLGSTVALFPAAMFPAGASVGLWAASGGEATATPGVVKTASCAIGIIANDVNSVADFDKGIVFHNDSIAGTDGNTGEGIAIAFAKGHTMRWFNNSNQETAKIISSNGDVAKAMTLDMSGFGVLLLDKATGRTFFQVDYVANAVNALQALPSVTTAPVQFAAIGDDTNIDLQLTPKGTGNVRFGFHTAIGAETVTGYITIKDAGGTSRKIAVVS